MFDWPSVLDSCRSSRSRSHRSRSIDPQSTMIRLVFLALAARPAGAAFVQPQLTVSSAALASSFSADDYLRRLDRVEDRLAEDDDEENLLQQVIDETLTTVDRLARESMTRQRDRHATVVELELERQQAELFELEAAAAAEAARAGLVGRELYEAEAAEVAEHLDGMDVAPAEEAVCAAAAAELVPMRVAEETKTPTKTSLPRFPDMTPVLANVGVGLFSAVNALVEDERERGRARAAARDLGAGVAAAIRGVGNVVAEKRREKMMADGAELHPDRGAELLRSDAPAMGDASSLSGRKQFSWSFNKNNFGGKNNRNKKHEDEEKGEDKHRPTMETNFRLATKKTKRDSSKDVGEERPRATASPFSMFGTKDDKQQLTAVKKVDPKATEPETIEQKAPSIWKSMSFDQFKTPSLGQFKTPSLGQFKTPSLDQFKSLSVDQLRSSLSLETTVAKAKTVVSTVPDKLYESIPASVYDKAIRTIEKIEEIEADHSFSGAEAITKKRKKSIADPQLKQQKLFFANLRNDVKRSIVPGYEAKNSTDIERELVKQSAMQMAQDFAQSHLEGIQSILPKINKNVIGGFLPKIDGASTASTELDATAKIVMESPEVQKFESAKSFVTGAIMGGLNAVPFLWLAGSASVELDAYVAALQAGSFAAAYRYAADHPNVIMSAFVVSRTLSEIEPSTDWRMIAQLGLHGLESYVMFRAAALVMDIFLVQGWIRKPDDGSD